VSGGRGRGAYRGKFFLTYMRYWTSIFYKWLTTIIIRLSRMYIFIIEPMFGIHLYDVIIRFDRRTREIIQQHWVTFIYYNEICFVCWANPSVHLFDDCTRPSFWKLFKTHMMAVRIVQPYLKLNINFTRTITTMDHRKLIFIAIIIVLIFGMPDVGK